MDDASRSRMSTAELLATTWRVWRSHAGMFGLMMGIPVFGLVALVVNYVIAPHPDGIPLQEVWLGMGLLQKVAVLVLSFGIVAMQYRALAASSFATQEISGGRSVGSLRVFGSVRRKQLRLFWMVMLVSLVTGPLGVVLGPILAFATAPGFPVAILENRTAIAAIRRGDALTKGGRLRIAVLFALGMGLVIVAVLGWVSLLVILEQQFGRPWFLRPVPILGMWIILFIPQLYMIALTLNYLEQRGREGEIGTSTTVLAGG